MLNVPPMGVIAAITASILALSAAPSGAQPLALGFVDPSFQDATVGSTWMTRARSAGATTMRFGAVWANIAPNKPSEPTDPADPAYRWGELDEGIRSAASAGFTVTILANVAPAWAEGPNRPDGIRTGTWRPDPVAFGNFGSALATRYSGRFPDPEHPGSTLPRVGLYQAWNEPNLSIDLSPQWQKRGRTFTPASPGWYRRMLNAFYRGVKSADETATVVAAGTAPFGDPGVGGRRLPPAFFWRQLLCLSGGLRPLKCPDPAHFDIADHHPYSVGGPSRRARNADDVSIPDLAKITRPLSVAVRRGTVAPRVRKRLWITEVSWDGSPPDPDGVPERKRAHWLSDALYLLWKQGADTVTWYLIRDQAPDPDYASTYQSGLYTTNGRPKLALRAFAFPLAVARRSASSLRLWTRSPQAGVITFEVLDHSGRWQTAGTVHVRRFGVVMHTVGTHGGRRVRARIGSHTSLPVEVP